MPGRKDYEFAPQKLIFRDTEMKFSDKCTNCKHSRADHLVSPLATESLHAVAGCNLVIYEGENPQTGRSGKGHVAGKECNCERFED